MYLKFIVIIIAVCAIVVVAQTMLRKVSPGSGATESGRRINMTADELRQMTSNKEDIFILDVRNPDELVSGPAPLKGAVNIPLPELSRKYSQLPRDKTIVVVCHSGFRSAKAADALIREGFTKVYNLQGGMAAYVASGR